MSWDRGRPAKQGRVEYAARMFRRRHHLTCEEDTPMGKPLAATITLLCTLAAAPLFAEEGPASQRSMAEQLVDAFNAVFGVHPGVRANHTKGVVLEGTFT